MTDVPILANANTQMLRQDFCTRIGLGEGEQRFLKWEDPGIRGELMISRSLLAGVHILNVTKTL